MPELLRFASNPSKCWRYNFICNPSFKRARFSDILMTGYSDLIEETTAVCPIEFGMLNKERPTCVAKHGYHLLSV